MSPIVGIPTISFQNTRRSMHTSPGQSSYYTEWHKMFLCTEALKFIASVQQDLKVHHERMYIHLTECSFTVMQGQEMRIMHKENLNKLLVLYCNIVFGRQ